MAAEQVASTRYLILLGKAGAGKSTLANHITGTHEFLLHNDVESITRGPIFSSAKTVESPDNILYNVKMLDTVGLVGDPRVTKESLIAEITEYNREIRGDDISLAILFVVACGRYKDEEWNVFRYIINHFSKSQFSTMSALVVTRCEDLHEEARSTVVDEIRSNAGTADVAKFMGKGIYPVGFPDPAKLKPGMSDVYEECIKLDEETLRQIFGNVEGLQVPDEHPSTARVQPSAKIDNHCTVM